MWLLSLTLTHAQSGVSGARKGTAPHGVSSPQEWAGGMLGRGGGYLYYKNRDRKIRTNFMEQQFEDFIPQSPF